MTTIALKQTNYSCWLSGLVFLLVSLSLATSARAENEFHDKHVERGSLIIATDKLSNTDFDKAVIYITEHGEHGSYGLIINKPTHMMVNEAMPENAKTANPDHHIFFGGPFHVTALFVLTRDGNHENLHTITENLFFGAGDATTIELNGKDSTDVTRTFIGFSNWGPGQLQSEIDAGVWVAVPGDSSAVFSDDPQGLWTKLNRDWSGDWI